MLNVHLRGAFACLAYAASALALLAAPAIAQTYHDSGGTIPPAVVPLVGCSSGGNCSGPVSNANPMPVSGTFSATLSGFTPAGAYATPLAVSATSARVALPTGTTIVVYNPGASTAYVILGNSSATATSSDDVVPAGGWMAFSVGANTYLAAISASGTTTLNVSGGSGLPTGAGGGGGGSASVPTGTAGSPNAAVLSIQGVAGGTAQAVSAASLPLPAGAATSANQEVTAAGTSATSAQAVQGVTGGVAMPVNDAPTSSSSLAISHGAPTNLGNSLVAKASAGNLYGFNCTAISGGAAGYCVAVNAASAPSTGALSGVLDACYFAAGPGGCSLSRANFPANYSTGIVILVTSAASPFTYTTGTDTAFISADYQ